MVILENNQLEFRFPEIHAQANCTISFQRTLRIPDDNREHPLPPGLGDFPLLHVEDYSDKLPSNWEKTGGVFLPMYQAEAMWINFDSIYPFAIKIAAGKINAVNGKAWSNELCADPQDYLVLPDQPWLDGFCVSKGLIRQFVAMPLGSGYTAEEQITGKAEVGGIQIIAYPMKAEHAETYLGHTKGICYDSTGPSEMGLAPGGLMRQQIYQDDYGVDVWETGVTSRCFVRLLNSEQYLRIAGVHPPNKPPTAADYTKAGLPWFEYYGKECSSLAGSQILAGMHSVAAKQVQLGEKKISDTIVIDPWSVIKIGPGKRRVKAGLW